MKFKFSPLRFSYKKSLLILFIGCLTLFTGCKKEHNYSHFPKDSVLKGELADGRQIYLIRENDSTDMKGTGFIYDGKAVAKTFSFNATDSGIIFFEKGEYTWQANSSVKQGKKLLNIFSLNIPEYDINGMNVSFSIDKVIEKKFLCEEKRYSDVLFHEFESSKNLEYGKAMGHYTSQRTDTIPHGDIEALRKLIMKDMAVSAKKEKELPLLLDFYQPATDTLNKRPAFLFIHGGAFYFGDKENALQERITKNLVEKGFVLFSMNYRLGDGLLGFGKTERTIFRGVQDARAALRYIIEHSKQFGIDPHQIYIGGSSAGAIISLATAFMDEDEIYHSANNKPLRKKMGNLDCVGNDYKHDCHIAGVVSLWGAVSDLSIIDKRDSDIPVLLIHGTSDQIVPDTAGLPFQARIENKTYNRMATNWQLYGSYSIYNHMKKLGMQVTYVPLFGYGHEPQVSHDGTYNSNMDIINEEMDKFLYQHVSEHYFPYTIIGNDHINKQDNAPFYSIQDTYSNNIQWEVDGGFIIDKQNNGIKVVWYDTTTNGTVKFCTTDENNITWQKEMKCLVIKGN